ncbi:MAG: spermidine/putrescine ABC transporter substrate-binding protein [Planctomycetes bacterium]|nr:spermidine/putrescine ABC transporter substrate-binding protein [Planctomycetota bacterium]
MKTTGNLLRGAVAAIALCVLTVASALAGERVLHVYTWSDYFDSEVIAAFERDNKCRVYIDYFDSNESMYAKLKAGGGGYDVITPSSYMSAVMRSQGMVMDLDHALLPNLQYMDKNFTRLTEDPTMAYSVPYTRTVTGVGYDTKRVNPADIGTWDIFASGAYAKRMTMLNDMRETIGAALKHLGYSLNTTDRGQLAQAGDVVIAWKRNLAKFDVDEAKFGLASGEFIVIHSYNGDIALVMEENPDVSFYIPAEGSSLASDDFIIASDSPSAELAHAFINHLLNPDIALMNMESIRYFMPNTEAVSRLPADLADHPAFNVPDSVMEKCEVIRDLGEDNQAYIQVWDRIKAAE